MNSAHKEERDGKMYKNTRMKKEMNKAMIKIRETAQEIEEMMKKEKEVNKLKRLQMLYLIKIEKVKTRKEVGEILGLY